MARKGNNIVQTMISNNKRLGSVWKQTTLVWNDSMTKRFEANYWIPLNESYKVIEKAADRLTDQINRILSELP